MQPESNLASAEKTRDNAEKKIKRYKEQDPVKVSAYLQAIEGIPKDKLAYVDETGIDSYLYRTHCYASKGVSVIGRMSGKKYCRVGIVAAKMGKEVLSPLQYDGTMDSKLFEAWFETRLMRELPYGSFVVMDNAAFHRKKQLIRIAEIHGHTVIFLPPYSPELNPIEHFWAWLKQRLRNTLEHTASFDLALMDCF